MNAKKMFFGWICAASIVCASISLTAEARKIKTCYDEDGQAYACPK